jgi:hypothetical protein
MELAPADWKQLRSVNKSGIIHFNILLSFTIYYKTNMTSKPAFRFVSFKSFTAYIIYHRTDMEYTKILEVR